MPTYLIQNLTWKGIVIYIIHVTVMATNNNNYNNIICYHNIIINQDDLRTEIVKSTEGWDVRTFRSYPCSDVLVQIPYIIYTASCVSKIEIHV